MRYFKMQDGRLAEYSGPQMGAAWYAANGWLPYAGTLGVDWLYIDADGALAEFSAEEYAALHPADTREWADKRVFIKALKSLIPAENLQAVATNWETIFAIAQLPGEMVDTTDPDLIAFVTGVGLTIDQVKNKMEDV